MIAAIYTRVSTDEQAREGLSLAVQERRCREAAEAHGATTIDVYQDEGYTSRDLNRPALQQLLDRLDRYDRIYTLDQSRWTRDPADLEDLRARLLDAGVAIVPLSLPIDHDTPEGQLMSRVVLATDRFGIDVARAKCIASLRDRAERGLHHGNPPTGYALPADSNEPLIIDPPRARTVRRMFDMAARGLPLSAIAQTLTAEGVRGQRGSCAWHTTTIADILRNPVYRGVVTYQGEEFEGAHEPLVDPGVWHEVQALLRRRSVEHPARRARLSRLFACDVCGGRVSRVGSAHHSYRCEARFDRPADDRHEPLHKSAQAVEAVLWTYTAHLLSADALTAAVDAHEPSEQPDVEAELQAVEDRIAWNLEVAEEGGMPASWVVERNRELLIRREELLAFRGRSSRSMAAGDLAWLRDHGADVLVRLRDRTEGEQLRVLEMLYSSVRMHLEGLIFVHAVSLQPRGVAYPLWDASANAWGPVDLSPWHP